MKPCDLGLVACGRRAGEQLAQMLLRLGYRVAAVECSDPRGAAEAARALREAGLEAYTRATVEAERWQDVVRQVARLSLSYDLMAVKPRSAEAARLAARDPRVSLVTLTPSMARYMDKSQALMLREGGSVVELRLLPLLRGGDPRAALRGIMIIARRASAYDAAFTVTSGARSPWQLWPPASARALLEAFGVPPQLALLALTAYCRKALDKALAGEGR